MSEASFELKDVEEVRFFATYLAKMMDECGAENYLTMNVISSDSGVEYEICVQKAGHTSPAKRIADLEAQLAERDKRIEALELIRDSYKELLPQLAECKARLKDETNNMDGHW